MGADTGLTAVPKKKKTDSVALLLHDKSEKQRALPACGIKEEEKRRMTRKVDVTFNQGRGGFEKSV